jgi:thiamine transport system substrate-binding protein
MKRAALVVAIAAVALTGAACGSAEPTPDEITLITHGSFAVSDGVLEAFTKETGVAVNVLQSADAGTMVNQAILTKDNPIADVLYGIDNTFLSRAVAEELFIPYEASNLDVVPDALQVPDDQVTPIDFGDVCINVDPAGLGDRGIELPQRLADLTDPAYRGTVVVEDPSTSSPGLAFLLATISVFGEDGEYPWQAYWEDLVANDVQIVPGWEQAYYGEFSGGSGEGERPIVVSYATSPVAEVYFSDLDAAPTTVVEDGCFRQIEYAGILRGTEAESTARRLVDFLLARTFQEDVPLNMFVFPANEEAELPDVFVEHATIPADPVIMDPAAIEENRDRWLAEWATIVR